jgi:hypothetical protein
MITRRLVLNPPRANLPQRSRSYNVTIIVEHGNAETCTDSSRASTAMLLANWRSRVKDDFERLHWTGTGIGIGPGSEVWPPDQSGCD